MDYHNMKHSCRVIVNNSNVSFCLILGREIKLMSWSIILQWFFEHKIVKQG